MVATVIVNGQDSLKETKNGSLAKDTYPYLAKFDEGLIYFFFASFFKPIFTGFL